MMIQTRHPGTRNRVHGSNTGTEVTDFENVLINPYIHLASKMFEALHLLLQK